MDRCSADIMKGLKAFNLPYKFSEVTKANGDCFSLAITDQVRKYHWDSVLPRGRIQDFRDFKRRIVQFIRTDPQLNGSFIFEEHRKIMVNEDLIQRQSSIYGNLNPDQAYQKFLDKYATQDGIYAEVVIVIATPFFLGIPLCITEYLDFDHHFKDKIDTRTKQKYTPEQQKRNWENQTRWHKYGSDIETPEMALTLGKSNTFEHYQSIIPTTDQNKLSCCRGCTEAFSNGPSMVAHLRADPICGGLYSASDIANIERPQENVTTVETPSTSSTPACQDDLRDPTSIQGKSEWHLVENRKRRSQASSNVEAMCSKKSKPDQLLTSDSSKATVKKTNNSGI